jgi:hypothetical protein
MVVKVTCFCSEVVLQTMNYKGHYDLFWFMPFL